MPRRVHEEDSRVIEGAVRQHPDGLTAQQIDDALQSAPPRRTLQYRLKSLVTSKRLVMEGTGSHRRTAAGTEAAPLWLRIESRRCSSSCSAGCPGRDRERQRAHGGPSGSCPASGRGPRVLDVGCGTGAQTLVLALSSLTHRRRRQPSAFHPHPEPRGATPGRREQAGSARGGHAPTRLRGRLLRPDLV